MSVPQLSAEQRGEQILAVFDTAFGELLAADPAAFRVKFRKMAASAFAFYRGTAGLFYHDLTADIGFGSKRGGPYLDERTSRVWIHGDLHAENFGTYMDANGRLIFNVNDFDEAYVGPFTWDLKRFAASVALVGYAKALSDDQITELVKVYAAAYRERIHALATGAKSDEVPPFTLDTAEGPLLDALRDARSLTRFGLLDSMTEIRDFERRFAPGGGSIELDAATRYKVLAAFDGYLETLPESSLTRPDSYRVKDVVGRRGIGIGSAGLPSYNILLEGNSDALENDVVIYIKQAQTPAVSRHITDPSIREYFQHEGHRTVISQRALQAHADPWLGWTELDGAGQLVAEVSPYAVDLDWGDIDDPEEIASVVADLGRATATMHAAADDESGHSELVPFSTERAIDAAIAADEDGFAGLLVDFAHSYGARARADHQIFVDLFRNGRIPGL
ncbi:DUF2252 domain-containing protein [Streptomyces sp. NPDC059837]|jgi:uncharacterized protein (DUF2252 family)|uniref:DUF2252 domain-containing protein n=1 Tax=unclassified Streptomyces TaxID=2593676 RepID=UPI00225128AF|nr:MULTISPECIES: DUF2252 domain-containing protein [unclassified Streptomyces]MCX4401339.1 DUF2252 domain-containing protein [Streptomyces sp. NBC_01764]MCX4453504.1 DUF2252 domain-containing protein [Streptomyces sp. NBC_01719]MCX4492864.1 DUF2252 domain-containing protein [Streptomyces sp. NBC_01728]MCX4592642.1 DUF2252 domain-containing protein [Streptomyces sp. NBC_01549]MCX5089656.1 DUF2252 domain-containing protein [Streptomyces sp. NBC_00365]